MIYACCDPNRRNVLERQSVYNGIDFLEVVDNPFDPGSVRQRTLLVHFVHDLLPAQLGPGNVVIEGGERIRHVEVVGVEEEGFLSPGGDAKVLVVRMKEPGDFSTYTLRLVDSSDINRLPPDFDPILSRIDFSFKAGCHSDFDCQAKRACPPQPAAQPDISYLARDYSSFRQLMLDRLAKIIPEWQEKSPADLGIVLLEIVAYVGDYLSYLQDAVATEAYLGTARKRTSVRRHARLVGYPMNDGRNARTWVHFDVRSDVRGKVLGRRGTDSANKLLTRVTGQSIIINIKNSNSALQEALAMGAQVFEVAEDIALYAEHNQMSFYTWGSNECCLPRGATQAWLNGKFQNLQPGDVLIFKEVKGPNTGVAEDADPLRRCAVRLTDVSLTSDPIGGQFLHPPTNQPADVTWIEWSEEDALPFPICISSRLDTEQFSDVSIVLGNIGLADHGNTIEGEQLSPVPAPNPALTVIFGAADDPCNKLSPRPSPARFRPLLQQSPVTFADPYDGARELSIEYTGASSSMTLTKSGNTLTLNSSGADGHAVDLSPGQGNDILGAFMRTVNQWAGFHAEKNPDLDDATPSASIHDVTGLDLNIGPYVDLHRDAKSSAAALSARTLDDLLPQITLTVGGQADAWNPQRDLLNSHSDSREFVVEVENDGSAYLRFGDGTFGERPTPGTTFLARYRVGNFTAGNIGSDSLYHLVSDDPVFVSDLSNPLITGISNPLAASGGLNMESLESVRHAAPYAFQVQDRAVTAEDYGDMAQKCDATLQKAVSTFRWTGSWYTVSIAADRKGGRAVDDAFRSGLQNCMERFRMAGHDVEVGDPAFVSLEINLTVCVKPDYFATDIEAALDDILSNRILPDGTRGAFHPDNFTFGQTVYLSPLYALVQSTPGVDSAVFTKFQRQGIDSDAALNAGKLELNRLEIARLDNDPNFAEHGVLRLNMMGGR